jgi:hypothetical protein
MCKKGMSAVPPNGNAVRQVPRFKSVRLNIEKNDISMIANLGGRPLSVNFETKKIKKITIQPVRIKKLFRQVNAEQIVFEFSEMPRIPGIPPVPANQELQPPPRLIFEEKACGKEFGIYKRLLARFSSTNNIEFSDATESPVSEEASTA